MRSILFALSLIGCSDYEINLISAEEPTAPASTSDVPADEPETNENDVDTESTDTATTEEPVEETGPEADGECGFHLQNGPMDEAFTQTYLSYELVSPEVDLLNPGDTIELWYGITANPCGDAEVLVLQYALEDKVTFDEWLLPEYEEEAYMRDPSDEFVFHAAAANGVTSDELHFVWSDGYYPLGYDNTGEMDTILIEAGETKWFVFEFKDTELAPLDTIADTWLSTIIWRDVGTEQEVQGWADGHTDIWSTVQFVE